MDGVSVWYWMMFVVVIFLWIFPLWRIIGRTGRHPALALFGFFPLTALVVLWWLAFARWPATEGSNG